MKEAAGEANLTVVAIILIAVVVAVATPIINSLMKTAAQKACCTDAGGYVKDHICYLQKGEKNFDRDGWMACCHNAKGGNSDGSRNPCQNTREE